jgi:SAM-dependent methyltransferase
MSGTDPGIAGAAGPGERLEALQKKYGLSYHVMYALTAEESVGLRGRRVLEVGGSLPRAFVEGELGVAQWVGIQETTYWSEIATGAEASSQNVHAPVRLLRDVTGADQLGPYEVLGGGIEDLPAALEGAFDVVFSIATFEHILTLPVALARMYAALRPGGKLFTMFSPLWSAHDGHHLPDVTDKQGRTFSFGNVPIPPWGHLLMRPSEMMEYLARFTDRDAAAKMTYYIYHSPHINRLFTEDYVQFVKATPFRILTMLGTFEAQAPEELKRELERLYPGRHFFTNNGLQMVLERPE